MMEHPCTVPSLYRGDILLGGGSHTPGITGLRPAQVGRLEYDFWEPSRLEPLPSFPSHQTLEGIQLSSLRGAGLWPEATRLIRDSSSIWVSALPAPTSLWEDPYPMDIPPSPTSPSTMLTKGHTLENVGKDASLGVADSFHWMKNPITAPGLWDGKFFTPFLLTLEGAEWCWDPWLSLSQPTLWI